MSDAAVNSETRPSNLGSYFALLKPRVMSLVVFTAAIGLLAAPGGISPLASIASILLIAIGGGASGALNMWWDADIDILMRRVISGCWGWWPIGRQLSCLALPFLILRRWAITVYPNESLDLERAFLLARGDGGRGGMAWEYVGRRQHGAR